jgi:hypothetical protein
MKKPSIGGSYYFLAFIDDYTRKTWVFFLRNRNEWFDYFHQFIAPVEKQS